MAFSTTITADGNTEEFTATGQFEVNMAFNAGTGTVALEKKLLDGTWVEVTSSALTATGSYLVDGRGVARYRFAASSTAGATIFVEANDGGV